MPLTQLSLLPEDPAPEAPEIPAASPVEPSSPSPAALPSSKAPRRRPVGAPPGNTNALKHGFYSNQLSPADLADLSTLRGDFDLQDEAGLMRVYIRRLVALARAPQTAADAASLLRVICLASLTLNRLLRTRFVLRGGANSDLAGLRQVLSHHDDLLPDLNAFLAERRPQNEPASAPAPQTEGDPQ